MKHIKTTINGIIAIFLVSLLSLSGCGLITEETTHGQPLAFPKSFVVQNNKIVDSNGDSIQFRGLCPVDPIQQQQGLNGPHESWDATYYSQMANWGANLIRLPIHPKYYEATDENGRNMVIDQAINWCAQNNMYVMIDFHSIGYPPQNVYDPNNNGAYLTSTANIVAFWETMATRYKDNNVVALFELFNEPTYLNYIPGTTPPAQLTSSDWIPWRNLAETIIDAIRAIDPDRLVLVNGLRWAYDCQFANTYPIRRTGVIYGVHPYPNSWRDSGTSWETAFGSLSFTKPVLITEFGFSTSFSSYNPGTQTYEPHYYEGNYPLGSYRDDIMTYLEGKRLGWVAWCFSKTWTPKLYTDSSYNPSDAGTFFKTKLQSLAQ